MGNKEDLKDIHYDLCASLARQPWQTLNGLQQKLAEINTERALTENNTFLLLLASIVSRLFKKNIFLPPLLSVQLALEELIFKKHVRMRKIYTRMPGRVVLMREYAEVYAVNHTYSALAK